MIVGILLLIMDEYFITVIYNVFRAMLFLAISCYFTLHVTYSIYFVIIVFFFNSIGRATSDISFYYIYCDETEADFAFSRLVESFLDSEFTDANILPLTFLCYQSVSNLMHDINNSNAPINILKLFRKTSNVHSYNTRSSTSGNFYVQNSRLEIHKRSFSRFGVRPWNEMPRRIRDLPKKEFKGEIRRLLLNILVNENDYIETPIIVQKIVLAN